MIQESSDVLITLNRNKERNDADKVVIRIRIPLRVFAILSTAFLLLATSRWIGWNDWSWWWLSCPLWVGPALLLLVIILTELNQLRFSLIRRFKLYRYGRNHRKSTH